MRTSKLLLAAGLFLLLIAAVLFLSAVASAELRFLHCTDGFSIRHVDLACRAPAKLQLASLFALSSSIAMLAGRVILKRRGSRQGGG